MIFNLREFGAVGDGITNDTAAFKKAARAITDAGGGTLVIPKGTYIVCEQTFAGTYGKGYSFSHTDIFYVRGCTEPVAVEGNGATIKVKEGLHYGSFNPVTGEAHHAPPGLFLDINYAAQVGAIFYFQENKDVLINDLIIDGSRESFVIGGYYGDTGIQLGAFGVRAYDNKRFTAINVKSNNNGLDGFTLQNTVASENEELRPFVLEGVEANNNGRLGVAYTGGNSLIINNSKFNNNGALSAPASGLDIEAEVGLAYGGRYYNCEFTGNKNTGIVCDSAVNSYDHAFTKCTFVGEDGWALYIRRRKFLFKDCLIVGSIAGAYEANNADDPDRTKFIRCTFSFDRTLSPSGKVFGTFIDLGGSGSYTLFDSCFFDGGQQGNVPYTVNVVYRDCTFKMLGNPPIPSYPYGKYYGTTRFETRDDSKWGYTYCFFYGPWYLNGVLMNGDTPVDPQSGEPHYVPPPVKKDLFEQLGAWLKKAAKWLKARFKKIIG